MALFSRQRSSALSPPERVVARFGWGRRLTTAEGPAGAAATLELVLGRVAPAPYQAMGVLYPAAVSWSAADPEPTFSFSCQLGPDDIYLVTISPAAAGAVIGLFPLGAADAGSLTVPLPGYWKGSDNSLSSVGVFEPGTVALAPPRLADSYLEDLISSAGYPATANNVSTLSAAVGEVFVLKASQFIGSTDPRAASTFVDTHHGANSLPALNGILYDLGSWNPQVIPYIQDLPYRVRGLLLERLDDAGTPAADVWTRMERTEPRNVETPLRPQRPVVARDVGTAPVARPAATSGPRCANTSCSNYGQALASRQCPQCFHYAPG